jgi:peptide methionine sulfoxide reductase msrA/msrB
MIAEIVFAAGCFWGVEKHFENIDGVVDVKSGYVGGSYPNPTYEKVLKYRNLSKENPKNLVNYTEAVLVKFNTKKVSSDTLIKSFWELHNPTTLNKQGNDVGNNYRSGIFYTNERQKNIAFATKENYQTLLNKKGYGKIVTEIKPLVKFWVAEEYHQDYLKKHPFGYCPNHSTGVKFDKNLVTPLGGKEIIVVTSEYFCPYCKKLEKDVTSKYSGTIPLRTVYAKNLSGFKLTTTLNATPIILFINDGKEDFGNKGYLTPHEFYELLGMFKLGKNSEAYNVAFNQGTDNRFCKQYDIFKNTPDGVFVDKLSGDILFDTKDRFNSKTGWLSFYKSHEESVIEKKDYSYGMVRTEVIAKKSGIHLGHVFDEFGHRRFCINATVLEFVPREKVSK